MQMVKIYCYKTKKNIVCYKTLYKFSDIFVSVNYEEYSDNSTV